MKFLFTSALFLCLLPLISSAQKAFELSRRATFDASISNHGSLPGATVKELDAKTPLYKAGVRVGDVILSVGDRQINNSEDWYAIVSDVTGGKATPIIVRRGSAKLAFKVKLKAMPLEEHPNLDTYYESVTSNYGITHRTIITKPKSSEKQPAIIVIGGLSCSSIEVGGRTGNWHRTLRDIVRTSNMVVMRVEKSGVGDSDGDCGQADFNMDLAGYEAAILDLKSKPYVDSTRIVVYGSSMGSAIAPYLANTHKLAGVISDGTFFKSWYEHMLEIERRILRMEGKSEADIYRLMNEVFIPVYHGMLIQKKSYAEILTANPLYIAHHRQGLYHMYGRPVEYYHQVQDFNFAAEWEKLTVPVRIRWGTNDWIMTENDNDMIANVLKRNGHSDYELEKIDGLDHWNTIHPNATASFTGQPGKWDDHISAGLVAWAREMAGLE